MNTGSRGRYGCLAVVAVIVAALVALFAWIIPSFQKSYTIDDVRIDAAVQRDGRVLVDERFSYTFEGDYTRVYRDIPLDPLAPITVTAVTGPDGPLRRLPSGWTPAAGAPVAVTPKRDATPSPWTSIAPEQRPPGYYRVTFEPSGPSVRIEAFAKLSDRSATFVFRWVAANAARRWADTGELWWQLIGRGWDVPMEHVEAVVTLPGRATKDDVRIWGHGPLNGVAELRDDGSASLTVDDLAANTFVEVHLLFPARLLPAAQPAPFEVLEDRLAEEAGWAREANEERRLAREIVEADRRSRRIFRAVAGALALGALGVWLVLFFTGGREYRPRFRAKYLREVPEGLTPALVGALWRMGTVTNDDITATLLDLAVKGVLRIEPEGGGAVGAADAAAEKRTRSGQPTFRLTLDRSRLSDVDELTLRLVTLLFDKMAKGDTLTMRELKQRATTAPATFHAGIEGWRFAVQERACQMGFLEKSGGRRVVTAALVCGVAALATFVVFTAADDWWLSVPLIACVALTLMTPVMWRRSREAAELYARYRALFNYLRDFGRLHEKPPTAVVLWEKYLVMAVVFGIADKVLEQMHVHVPEVVAAAEFSRVYWFATPDHATGFGGVTHAVSSFTGGVSAAVAAASPSTSSSGRGGGFSRGGGGGFSRRGGGRGGGGGGAD